MTNLVFLKVTKIRVKVLVATEMVYVKMIYAHVLMVLKGKIVK